MHGVVDGGRRAYELRLSTCGDGRLQEAAARIIEARAPGATAEVVRRRLVGAGFVMRMTLSDGEAAALLRELYAVGVPPPAVALVPQPRRSGHGIERDLAPFLAGEGRFMLTWNWRAFLFGPLWYLRKGLYAKGLLLLAVTLVPIWDLAVTVVVSMAVLTYCGLVGNWDHYLWRVKGRQWW